MILLTNDDGIDAPGLAALTSALAGEDFLIAAPLRPMSECSHCVTTKSPLRIHRRGKRLFAIEGTPADCARVALLHLLPEMGISRESVRVLSGINQGGNLGADVYISGTVAAVREAAFFGIGGIAFSQYRRGSVDAERWNRASLYARQVFDHLRDLPLAPGEFWNVNFPWSPRSPGPDLVTCDRSRRPLPVKYETIEDALHYVPGLYHTRDYEPGSDIDVCFSGNIAITRMAV